MKHSLLVLDTLDDRREIWHLLHKLPPSRRIEFMDWCCANVSGPNGMRPTPSRLRMAETIRMAYRCDRADERLTNELYIDVLMLSSQWNLDLGRAAVELERWVRRPVPAPAPPPASGPCAVGAGPIRTADTPGNGRPAWTRSR